MGIIFHKGDYYHEPDPEHEHLKGQIEKIEKCEKKTEPHFHTHGKC